MSVRIDIDPATLMLREHLHRLVVSGVMPARDFEAAFEETVVVELRADGRTLNRLKKSAGPVADAITSYQKR